MLNATNRKKTKKTNQKNKQKKKFYSNFKLKKSGQLICQQTKNSNFAIKFFKNIRNKKKIKNKK